MTLSVTDQLNKVGIEYSINFEGNSVLAYKVHSARKGNKDSLNDVDVQ